LSLKDPVYCEYPSTFPRLLNILVLFWSYIIYSTAYFSQRFRGQWDSVDKDGKWVKEPVKQKVN
jgi:hypothetical protein